MKKERLVNIRFLFCVFIGLIFGILIGKFFLMHEMGIVTFILSVILMGALMILGVFYANKTKHFNQSTRFRKNVSFLLKCSSIGVFVAFCVGVLIVIGPIIKINNIPSFDNEVIVSGVACEYVDTEETYNKFILDQCCVVDGENVIELDCKIVVYTSTYLKVSLGDNITFSGNVSKLDYKSTYGFSQLATGIGYTTYASVSDALITSGKMSVRESIQNYVKEILDKNLTEDNANISYAVLFGQKHGLNRNITNMFSYVGISHILAVSGLHIGVLVSAIWFLLNKIKMNRYAKLGIFALLLIFYSYLCAFSPSVSRASIMAFVLAFCKTMKFEYDALSSLSIAGIIILLFSPLSLFSISFQLSFLCIFAIISLAPSISYLMDKIRIPKKFGDALAVSIATNVVILPVCMNSFVKVSLLGVVANLFVLPLFSLTYILLFGVVVFTCVIKPLGILLCVPNLFMHLIKVVANHISQLPFGVFKAFNVSYLALFLIVLVSLVIHFVISKYWIKGVAIGTISVITIIMLISSCLPTRLSGESIFVGSQRNTNVSIYCDDDNITMVGSNISLYNLEFMMKDMGLNDIDNIVAFDIQLNQIEALIHICREFNVKNIWIPSKFDYNYINDKFNNIGVDVYSDAFESGEFEVLEFNEDIIGIKCTTGIGNVLIPYLDNSKIENNYLINNYLDVDFVIVTYDTIWDIEDCGCEMIFVDKFSGFLVREN